MDEGLAGASDVDVLAAATGAGRLLLTLDRRFGDVRAYPPGTHAGIVVIRVGSQDAATRVRSRRIVPGRVELSDLASCIVVVVERRAD